MGRGPCKVPTQLGNKCPPAESLPQSCHKASTVRIAFVVAGQARGFISDHGFRRYWQHVVQPLAAPPTCVFGSCRGELPRVFLTLKMPRSTGSSSGSSSGSSVALEAKKQEMLQLLQPAAVSITVEREADGQLYADVHAARGVSTASAHPADINNSFGAALHHPECFWRDIPPHFVLSQAAVWWATMARAWRQVEAWERAHTSGPPFDVVLFSRPDIFFMASLGPACAYNLSSTWYAPPGGNTPDMLWLFPRHIAARVLTTYESVVVPCTNQPTSMCCNLSETRKEGAGSGRDADRVSYSNWIRTYYARHAGLVPHYLALRGWGLVAANPLKRYRNCTLHLGCTPAGPGTGWGGRSVG